MYIYIHSMCIYVYVYVHCILYRKHCTMITYTYLLQVLPRPTLFLCRVNLVELASGETGQRPRRSMFTPEIQPLVASIPDLKSINKQTSHLAPATLCRGTNRNEFIRDADNCRRDSTAHLCFCRR